MTDTNIVQLISIQEDALAGVLKQGARQLLAKAIEAEVTDLLERYSQLRIEGRPTRHLRAVLAALRPNIRKR